MRGGAFAIAWVLAAAAAANPPAAAVSRLVVVMDDLGYSLSRAERIMALPQPVTLGLLPFAPDTPAIAARALQTGHEVILHQPMESLPTARARPAEGTLTVGMQPARFIEVLDAALRAVPGIVGVNNHTGSRLTQDPVAMRQLMAHLAGRRLLFLDSRTTAGTVAYQIAREAQVPALQRDVFLDHVPHPAAIDRAFREAVTVARRQGHAIVIAHPYPVTMDFLERALRALPEDVALTSLATLVSRDDPATLARQRSPESPRRSLGQ